MNFVKTIVQIAVVIVALVIVAAVLGALTNISVRAFEAGFNAL